jgi:hypothetical protein
MKRAEARKPGNQIRSGFGPSFHGSPKTASKWQVSWLQGHLTNRAFPESSSGIVAVFIACLQLRDSEGIAPSSLLTMLAGHGTKSTL